MSGISSPRGTVEQAPDGARLVFRRDYPDPVEDVWAALTEPARLGRWIGRRLAHEWSLAIIASLLLAVVLTWPTLRYPLHTIPQDIWDPTLQAWQMAWSGHILLTNPGQLWHANTFYPEPWSFAFSDTLLGFGTAATWPLLAYVREEAGDGGSDIVEEKSYAPY